MFQSLEDEARIKSIQTPLETQDKQTSFLTEEISGQSERNISSFLIKKTSGHSERRVAPQGITVQNERKSQALISVSHSSPGAPQWHTSGSHSRKASQQGHPWPLHSVRRQAHPAEHDRQHQRMPHFPTEPTTRVLLCTVKRRVGALIFRRSHSVGHTPLRTSVGHTLHNRPHHMQFHVRSRSVRAHFTRTSRCYGLQRTLSEVNACTIVCPNTRRHDARHILMGQRAM